VTEDDDALLARVVAALKEPVRIDPDVERRVMAEIESQPRRPPAAPSPASRLAWLRQRRMIRLSPLGALAAAAAVVTLVIGGMRITSARMAGGEAEHAVASAPGEVTQFVLVAPAAASVTVVGDFNDWSLSATPLERQAGDGVWWVTLPLRPGRYRYAFVVDGTSWRSDPSAPGAEDEFGRANSVVTIGGA
jgi:hypothetical protein